MAHNSKQTLPHHALEYAFSIAGNNLFSMGFKPVTGPVYSWKEEIYKAAEKIASASTKTIYLCFSGGIDSEVMCQAFLDKKIAFKVLTLRYLNNSNQHDIRYAIEWCEKNKVAQEVIDFDIEAFLQDGYIKYAEQGFVSKNIFRYLQIKLMELAEERNGHAVLGAGEFLFDCTGTSESPSINFETGLNAPFEWCVRKNLQHQPYFYFTTPEMCLAYLQSPAIQFAVNRNDIFTNIYNVYSLKMISHYSNWPDKKGRPKYSGFENVKDARWHVDEKLKKYFRSYNDVCTLKYSELIQQLTKKA